MSFITGTSNFPANFDLFPTGTGINATLSYVLDEIRDSNGVITQSGNALTAIEMNGAYTVIDKIERTLGYNPEGSYADVSTRLTALSTSGPNLFLPVTGGTITGGVTFSGSSALSLALLTGNALKVTLGGNTTINGTGGNISLTTTGNISLTVGNYTLTGTSITAWGSNVAIKGNLTNTIQSATNLLVLAPTVTTTTNSIVPTGASVINLGTATSPFTTLYVNNIVSTGTGISFNNYVALSGSNMFGNLKMTGNSNIVLNTGSSIVPYGSGQNSVGTSNNPFSGIYTTNIYATNISGMSPINFQSDLRFLSGATIGASGTGIIFGSAANPINTIYATTIVGATISAPAGLVATSGASITGTITFTGSTASLTMASGVGITSGQSGTSNIGSTGSYFSNLYVNSINGRAQSNFIFNESLTGTTNGINKHFFFANSPTSAMIFVSGSLILPTTQYVIAGTSLYLTGSMYAPTTAPVAGMYIY